MRGWDARLTNRCKQDVACINNERSVRNKTSIYTECANIFARGKKARSLHSTKVSDCYNVYHRLLDIEMKHNLYIIIIIYKNSIMIQYNLE